MTTISELPPSGIRDLSATTVEGELEALFERSGRPSFRLREFARRNGFGTGLLVLVVVMIAAPLILLIYGSFSPDAIPRSLTFHHLTTGNYVSVYSDPTIYHVFGNTVIYSICAPLISVSIAGVLSFLTERTDLPFRSLIRAMVLGGFAMPGVVLAIAWQLTLDPRGGVINPILGAIWHPLGQMGVNSLPGITFVQAMAGVPIGYLLFAPLMRTMDPALDEAADVAGASRWTKTRAVTIRLIAPGAAAVLMYQVLTALESFEIPGLLGIPNKIYTLATALYAQTSNGMGGEPAYNRACTLGVLILVLAAAAITLYLRVLRRASRFATTSGRGFRPRRSRLGRSKPYVMAGVALYLGVAVVLPFLVLVYVSLTPYLQPFSIHAFKSLGFSNYSLPGYSGQVVQTLENTALMIGIAATAAVLLSSCVAFVVTKSRFRARRLLDAAAFVPHGIPGIVMGLAFFFIFLNMGPIFGTTWALMIVFTVGFLAYGTRTMNAAFLQIHPELLEAGRASGASSWTVVKTVLVPLVRPAALGLWLLCAISMLKIASMPLMLTAGVKNQVLSVMLWLIWQAGSIQAGAALGVMIMVSVFVLVFFTRRFIGRDLNS